MKFNQEMIKEIGMSIVLGTGCFGVDAIVENVKALTEILDVDKETVLKEMCTEIAGITGELATADDLVKLAHETEQKHKQQMIVAEIAKKW